MKKSFLLIVAIILLFQLKGICQPPPPKPVAIPIDGGLAVLIIAGAVYSARKIYKAQKEKE